METRTYRVTVAYDRSTTTLEGFDELKDLLRGYGEVRLVTGGISVDVECCGETEFDLGWECNDFEREVDAELRSRGHSDFKLEVV